MYSMEPVIKRGFYAWDRAVLPIDEYTERVRLLQVEMAKAGLSALVVFGNQYNDPDLAYLIGGRIEGAVVITQHADPVVLSVSGGREEYIQRLAVWTDNLRCIGPRMGTSIVEELRSRQVGNGRIGTVGMDGLTAQLHTNVTEGLEEFELESFDEAFRALRRVPRSREVLAVRRALDIAQKAAVAGAGVYATGGNNAEALVEAERVARLERALDVRVMANIGADELRPFEGVAATRKEPLLLWLAARYQGYWGEAAIAAGNGATDDAEKAVEAMIAAAGADTAASAVAEAGLRLLPPEAAEAALVYGLGAATGLSREAAPRIAPGSSDILEEGTLLLLHVLSCTPSAPSFASATVQVGPTGATRLTPQSP